MSDHVRVLIAAHDAGVVPLDIADQLREFPPRVWGVEVGSFASILEDAH
jgi:hypothetical protein